MLTLFYLSRYSDKTASLSTLTSLCYDYSLFFHSQLQRQADIILKVESGKDWWVRV